MFYIVRDSIFLRWDIKIHDYQFFLLLDMNDTHQVLAYADDVNLVSDDIRIVETNADVLLNAFKETQGRPRTWK